MLHGIGPESRAPNPNTSKCDLEIGGKFIEMNELIRIAILFVRTVKLCHHWYATHMSITVAQIPGCRSVERGGDSRQNSCTSIEQGVRIVLYAVPAIHGTLLGPHRIYICRARHSV